MTTQRRRWRIIENYIALKKIINLDDNQKYIQHGAWYQLMGLYETEVITRDE